MSFWENEVRLEEGGEQRVEVDAKSKPTSFTGYGEANNQGSKEDPREVKTNLLNPNAPPWVPETQPQPIVNTNVHGQDKVHSQQIYSAIDMIVNLPKPELLTFDGNPADYWSFINNFEFNIGSKPIDSRSKLSYLLQFCKGKARNCIEGCVLLDVTTGYNRAREILRDQFGQPHVITRSLICKIINRPPIKPHDSSALWELTRDMGKCVLTVEQMGYAASLDNTDNLLQVQQLLPTYLQSDWAKYAQGLIQKGTEPKFKHMGEFVERAAKTANNVYGKNIGKVVRLENPKVKGKGSVASPRVTSFVTGGSEGEQKARQRGKCVCCSQGHLLHECGKFKAMTMKEKLQIVRKEKLCDNCFKPFHIARGCLKESFCGVNGCKRKHNALLHWEPVQERTEREVKGTKSSDLKAESRPREDIVNELGEDSNPSGESHTTLASQVRREVKLRTVPVRIKGKEGKLVTTWAVLDNGSDVTLCEENLLSELGLEGSPIAFDLTTVTQEKSKRKGLEISMLIEDLSGDESIDLPKVWSIDKLPISSSSISTKQDSQGWEHLEGINFPSIGDQDIRLFIGGDVPEAFWVLEERRGKRKEPYAVRGLLGWTLMGPTKVFHSRRQVHVNFVGQGTDDTLQKQVERFWETDFTDLNVDVAVGESVEDKRARAMQEGSVELIGNRYEVGLPWRFPRPYLPNNRQMALNRLYHLKKRLQKDEDLLARYKDEMEDYIDKGYARKVTPDKVEGNKEDSQADPRPLWYIPHHPVFHPRKPGKIRVVFDCAARYKGTSLNDQLLQGPDYTNNLVGVLSRFRKDEIAFISDIEAMFHQVRVTEKDQDALRFLWWQEGEITKEPQEYQMLVHIFGAKSSPSCAAYALRRTAEDNITLFDESTIQTIRENFYVDDCLRSVETKSETLKLVKELRELLRRGGFKLTKWMCNDKEVLASVPEEERSPSVVDLYLDKLPVEHTLGVRWDVEADEFGFETNVPVKPATRRGILAAVSSIYDPLGFLAPFILSGKRILQDLCRQGLGWDDPIGDRDMIRWQQWKEDLSRLSCVQVPRCFKPQGFGKVASSEIHIFCDASEIGYAAVAYLRIANEEGKIHCCIIIGKARLCPIKTVTIPRLELSAAVMAVQLDRFLQAELKFATKPTTFWTDSTTVLRYIRNTSTRFKTFVANRVTKIQNSSKPSQWRYIKSLQNPADEGSRGMRADDLHENCRWLCGPSFLRDNMESWPTDPTDELTSEADYSNELKKDPEVKVSAYANATNEVQTKLDELMERYSSWTKLRRAVAWLLRVKDYLRERVKGKIAKPKSGTLSAEEYQRSEDEIVRYVQRQAFPSFWNRSEPCKLDTKSRSTQAKSKRQPTSMRKLNPTLVNGTLRVGGRLKNAPIEYDAKHPVILPNKHHVTRLIITYHHAMVGHSGAGMTWARVREKYWVIKGGSAVRQIVGKCPSCKRRNARPSSQFMGDLPKERITPEKPAFTAVGVDYFGPIYIKQRRCQVKRYGCLFTCFATRAVHIEIAHSMDTDSFINCLRRFISRRGTPETIFSDNGSNFVAAERELREGLRELNQQKISDYLHEKGITWKFNPPLASHMGGVWERMIRSVRRILQNLMKEQSVCDETLLTVVAEVESILNSRPITQLSMDSADNEPLTPSHLLLLRPNSSLPPGKFVRSDGYGKRRWRQAQYLANIFWRRWLKEYLPLLHVRQKWTEEQENLKIDDLVLVVDENTPRGRWPLGRIMQVFPDKDGRVRQVEVKVGDKYLKRPIVKLCRLELHEN